MTPIDATGEALRLRGHALILDDHRQQAQSLAASARIVTTCHTDRLHDYWTRRAELAEQLASLAAEYAADLRAVAKDYERPAVSA